MKAPAKKAAAMSKGALADALATATEVKKIAMREASRHPCSSCDRRSEESWCVHCPRLVQDQNAGQASNQGREARDFRQDADREGKASQDSCEGFPCGCLKSQHLNGVSLLRF